MEKIGVLIYPAGADNAIEFYQSIKHSLHFKVYGANSGESIANLIFDNPVITLPKINESDFIKEINKIIKDRNIEIIVPTHDDVIYFLAKNKKKINCKILNSNQDTNQICRYKKHTYIKFKNYDFCPTVFESIEDIIEYPIFAKPDKGQGSIGSKLICSKKEIENINWEYDVVTEYLPGEEYTVDCLTDKDGKLVYVFPRERTLIRNGVSHINIEPTKDIINDVEIIAENINKEIKFNGLWFFQVKKDKFGKLKLLEICPRIATTMAFSRYKGVNLPLLSLFSILNLSISTNIINENIKLYRYSDTKVKYNFHYNKVYIDFDDTLIINNKICLEAISFIYQCLNNNIDVFLISKHEYDIMQTLKKYKISPQIFKEIIILPMKASKYKYINPEDAIFIDNYYFERKEVFEHLDIPVFDVDLIKTLIKS